MSSRIQVFVRLRPDPENSGVVVNDDGKSLEVKAGKRQGLVVNSNADSFRFRFDGVLSETASQGEVLSSCGLPFIQEFFQGYNCTILTYGQTGAGKTHTMMGPPNGSYHQRGLAPRIVNKVFEEVKRRRSHGQEVSLRMSAVEIYNEQMRDLLVSQATQAAASGPTLRDCLTSQSVSSEEDALHQLFVADMNRAMGSHDLNLDSTRSHCIYTLHLVLTTATGRSSSSASLEGIDGDDGSPSSSSLTAKLHMVDLAGSERIYKTGSTGTLLKEAGYINKSLSFLEQVVIALTDTKPDRHIPFRQTKLTHFLKDSLGGNCRTLLVACIWPALCHTDQTLSTLRFASRMMCIKNEPIVNRPLETSSAYTQKLLKQIKELKKELAMKDRLSVPGTASSTSLLPYDQDLTPEQAPVVAKQVVDYLLDDSNNIPIRTLQQTRAIFEAMRGVIHTAVHHHHTTIPVLLSLCPSLAPHVIGSHDCPPPVDSGVGPSTPDSLGEDCSEPPPPRLDPSPGGGVISAATMTEDGMAMMIPSPALSCFPVESCSKGSRIFSARGEEKGPEEEAWAMMDEQGERDVAFARFRMSETGMIHVSCLQSIKANINRQKDIIRRSAQEVNNVSQELATLQQRLDDMGRGIEEEEVGKEQVEHDDVWGPLPHTIHGSDLCRRVEEVRRRYRRRLEELNKAKAEQRGLQQEKKQCIQRLVKDFDLWLNPPAAPLSLPPLPVASYDSPTAARRRDRVAASTSSKGSRRRPQSNPGRARRPAYGGRPGGAIIGANDGSGGPHLSSAEVTYEIARQAALTGKGEVAGVVPVGGATATKASSFCTYLSPATVVAGAKQVLTLAEKASSSTTAVKLKNTTGDVIGVRHNQGRRPQQRSWG